jgi:Di- and tricarboxylate transporters
MNAEQGTVFVVLVLMLVLFTWGRWRYDLVALAALITLTLAGIIPPTETFAGFGHPAVITVAAVLVIGRTVQRSGAIETVARHVARITRKPGLQVMVLASLTAVCSAFMNNVAAVALLMPVAIRAATAANRPISQVLMPLSFASLLGGLVTLIGTPPNIIIASYRAEFVGAPFGVFDFSRVGLPTALVGIIFIAVAGWRLIPNRRLKSVESEQLFEISDYISEGQIPDGSQLIDQPLRALADRTNSNVKVVSLVRKGGRLHAPGPSTRLQQGDVLVLEGDPSFLQSIAAKGELKISGGEEISKRSLQSDDFALVEAVISPGSALEDRRASAARFRLVHGTSLLAISRQGRAIWRGLRDLRLRVGDVLLLHGQKDAMPEVLANLGCLPLAEREHVRARRRPNLLPIGLFALGIVAAAVDLVPVQVAFAATALLLVAIGQLPLREAYTSINWPIIVLVAALLPVGQALQETGGIELLARIVLDVAKGLPLLALLAIVIAATMVLSDVINNAAAAIVMAPFAVTIAGDLGASPDGFLMAVAIGSSCTFLTPIGHQSNTLVMGPAGYHFGDYWRLGLPLDLLIVATASMMILFVWC